MPRDINAEHRSSRWYKKQLLDRSDKELQSRMEKEGHSFISKMALKIKEAMRQTRTSAIRTASTGNSASAREYTGSFVANRAVLPLIGFRSLGGSFLKLGHSTWEVDGQDGDVVVRRLQEETKEAASFQKRKASLMDEALVNGLGYPIGVVGCMDLGQKMAVSQSRTAYCLPATPILIRGLPARVIARDGDDFMVEFLGTGIFDRQPIAKVSNRDTNSRLAALQESVEARIATGDFTLLAQQELEKELAADPVITREEIQEFAESADDAKKEALLQYVSQRNGVTSGNRTAQMSWTQSPHSANGSYRNYGEDDYVQGSVGLYTEGWVWQLFEDENQIARGVEDSAEHAQAACDAAARSKGKTAQMQRQWQDFNSAKVCDFSDRTHGMAVLKEEAAHHNAGEVLTQDCYWELYEEGKLIDKGTADTLGEAQEDCAFAASTLDSGNIPMLHSGDMAKHAQTVTLIQALSDPEDTSDENYTLLFSDGAKLYTAAGNAEVMIDHLGNKTDSSSGTTVLDGQRSEVVNRFMDDSLKVPTRVMTTPERAEYTAAFVGMAAHPQ